MRGRGAFARALVSLALALAALMTQGRAQQGGDLGVLQSGLGDPELLAELRRA